MIKALLFSSILATSFAIGHVETADACGIKMGAQSGIKARKIKVSSNPSRILILGDRDSSLIKKLKNARHKTEYASTVASAKRDRYDLVIADKDQMAEARERFTTAQVLKKKSSSKSTIRVAETMLARKSVETSGRAKPVLTNKTRKPVDTGIEKGTMRTATATGTETPAERVSPSVSPAPKPQVASVTQPATIEEPVKVERKAEPKVERKAPRAEPTVARTGPAAKWTRSFRFGTNKTALNSSASRRLRNNAKWMQNNPDAQIVIEGHTDSVGDEAYNLELSERRANAARDMLIGFGIDSSRISIEAKGEMEPATEPSTSARNRRVVLIKQ
jgi:outer membrane protein OmpA-like peptidoglycan-associated protein